MCYFGALALLISMVMVAPALAGSVMCVEFGPAVIAATGEAAGWKSKRKVVVLDANAAPIVGAKVYRRAPFIVDSRTGAMSLSDEATVVAQTDPNGQFSFELPQRGPGVLFLVVDESLNRIGHLRVPRKDQNDVHTVAVAAPAHIKATLESNQVVLSDLLVDIGFYEPRKRTVHGGFITVDYSFDEDINSIPLDIMCPSGCHLKFIARTQQYLKDIEKDIPPLGPGEVFDLGGITIEPTYGHTLIGQKPPKLDIAEWVKGEATTLEVLKGKVVLLNFWGLWCSSCCKKFPEIVRLDKKYRRDGLVIIAIHDCSLDKGTLLERGQRAVDLSDVGFRVGIDSPTSEYSGTQVYEAGKGKTIGAYGVTGFPTFVLIAEDGKVDHVGISSLEERINLLLYGHTKNLYKKTSFLQELLLLARKEFLLVGIGIGGLLLVGIYCLVRSRAGKQAKQV